MSTIREKFIERKNIKAKQREYDRQTSQKYGVTQGDIDKERSSTITSENEEKIDHHTKTKVLPAMGVGVIKWVDMMGRQKGLWR